MFTYFNFSIASLLPSDPDAMLPAAPGLFVSPERTIETDGHQVLIVTAPESQPTLFDQPDGLEEAQFFTPFIMDRDSALKLAKMFPKRDPDAPEGSMALLDVHTESESDATLALVEDVRRSIFKAVKRHCENFPDVDRILAGYADPVFEIAFSANILSSVLKAFQKFTSHGSGSIVMRLYGPERGMRIDAEACGQKMTALVMPQRIVESAMTREGSEA